MVHVSLMKNRQEKLTTLSAGSCYDGRLISDTERHGIEIIWTMEKGKGLEMKLSG